MNFNYVAITTKLSSGGGCWSYELGEAAVPRRLLQRMVRRYCSETRHTL